MSELPGLASTGIQRRLAQIFSPETGGAVIVPFDDVLISGPHQVGGGQPENAVRQVLQAQPDAVVGFPVTFSNSDLGRTAFIHNMTLSFEGRKHTDKFTVGDMPTAATIAASAIAVHVNCQSRYREEQFDRLGRLCAEAKSYGIPTIGFLYPRGERPDDTDENFTELRQEDPMAYARLVCEGVRRGVALGVDAIKTHWTGTQESFATVIKAAEGRPVVIAGGPRMDTRSALQMASDAREAGASGTSFGRNVFNNKDPKTMTTALLWIVHRRLSVDDAMEFIIDSPASHPASRLVY